MAQVPIRRLINQLQGLGKSVGTMDLHLLEVSASIINEIKLSAPEGDTKRLRQSIKSFVESNTLKIEMIYYGPFQNYGVIGSQQNRGVVRVPFGVNPRPANNITYQFKNVPGPVGGPLNYRARLTIRRRGLEPKDFFDVEAIEKEIALEIEERIINLR